jgi:hypothetical protein
MNTALMPWSTSLVGEVEVSRESAIARAQRR